MATHNLSQHQRNKAEVNIKYIYSDRIIKFFINLLICSCSQVYRKVFQNSFAEFLFHSMLLAYFVLHTCRQQQQFAEVVSSRTNLLIIRNHLENKSDCTH